MTENKNSFVTHDAMKAAWIAGVFDAGISANAYIGKAPYLQPRLRINRSSTNSQLILDLWRACDQLGTVSHTRYGVRWSIEGRNSVRKFLRLIEPYIRSRKKEVQLLLQLTEENCNPELSKLLIEQIKEAAKNQKV